MTDGVTKFRLQEIKLKIKEDQRSVSMGAPKYSRGDMRDDLELLTKVVELSLDALKNMRVYAPPDEQSLAKSTLQTIEDFFKEANDERFR